MKKRIDFTVFICGAILMTLEITGGRLLTPTYGASVYVWGSIIGLFLIGLSTGYYFGGKLSDKYPHLNVLSLIMTLSAFFIFIIPFSYNYITALFSLSFFSIFLNLFLCIFVL